jgi:hypothetical protein
MKWRVFKDNKPHATEEGDWDGKKTALLLVQCEDYTYHVVEGYEGTIDGFYYFEFFDRFDYQIEPILRWAELD